MEARHKQLLQALVTELRRLLEGDGAEPTPPIREAAYCWANRLLALRCMEVRELVDEIIVQRPVYGGRSLQHHRLVQRLPERCRGDDEGLFEVLEAAFAEQAERLPHLFGPDAPALAQRPSAACLHELISLLSGAKAPPGSHPAPAELFREPAVLGWAYQYWNAAAKERVFAAVRSGRGVKVSGADLIPATQLYTEAHLVRFLLHNSIGALWLARHPDSPLRDRLEYLVADVDPSPCPPRRARDLTVLDPACGSGHFLVEAFDLLYACYEEEGELREPEAICRSILEHNLFGIDIDERAVQLAEAALWMRAAERAFDLGPVQSQLVAMDAPLPAPSEALASFLQAHPELEPRRGELERLVDGLAHGHELGALLRFGGAAPSPSRPAPSDGPLFQQIEGVGLARRLLRHLAEQARADGRSERGHRRRAALLDLLDRRYAVVAMNPPYAGFRTLAPHLKDYLQAVDPDAALDLYVAFLSRFFDQLEPGGVLAAISPASWTTSSRTAELRRRVLRDGGPLVIAALGQRVFESAPLLFVALEVLGRGERSEGGHFVTLRPAGHRGAEGLGEASRGRGKRWPCAVVAELESLPFLPVAPPELLAAARGLPAVGDFVSFVDGLWSGSNERDVREAWEVPFDDDSWVPTSGGQGYARWYAPTRRRCRATHAADWSALALRSGALEYARVAGGKLSARWVPEGRGPAGPAPAAIAGVVSLLPKDEAPSGRLEEIAAVFNSRIGAVWLRTLSSGLNFNPGYAARIPLGAAPPEPSLVQAVADVSAAKRALARWLPTGDDFDPRLLDPTALPTLDDDLVTQLGRLRAFVLSQLDHKLRLQLGLLEAEHQVEQLLKRHLGMTDDAEQAIDVELGLPAAALPRELPPAGAEPVAPPAADAARGLPAESALEDRARQLGVHPQRLVDTGRDEMTQSAGRNDDTTAAAAPTGSAPTGGPRQLLHESAQALWRDGERELLCDTLGTLVLRLLGHRWPVTIASGGSSSDELAPAGIVPLIDDGAHPTALELVARQLQQDLGVSDLAALDRQLRLVLGKSLGRWLDSELFKLHLRQYGRRPILWQVQSRPAGRGRRPAWAGWLYAISLDEDTLPLIRSQHVQPFRQRLVLQLGADEVPGSGRGSRRLEERSRRLQDAIAELERFDQALGQVIEQGFACPELEALGADARTHGAAAYRPDLDDGVRVNVAPLQLAGLLAAPVLADGDVRAALADRAAWRFGTTA